MEDRLREHLQAKAQDIDVELTPFAVAERRRAWSPAAIAAAAAAVVVLAVGIPVLLTGGGSDEGELAIEPGVEEQSEVLIEAVPVTTSAFYGAPSGPPVEVAPVIGDGPVLNWVQGRAPDGYIEGMAGFQGSLIAWGRGEHEGGDEPPPLMIWRSADGLSWEAVDAAIDLDENGWFTGMAATDERLVITGMNPPPEPETKTEGLVYRDSPGTPFVLVSSDGVTWESSRLDVDLEEFAANSGLFWHGGEVRLAGGDQLVAVTTYSLEFDPSRLLEPRIGEFGIDPAQGYGVGFDGETVELFDAENNLVAEFTLEELGVEVPEGYDPGMGLLDNRIFTFRYDGSEWQPIEVTGLDAGWLVGLEWTGGAYVAVGESAPLDPTSDAGPRMTVWRSADGVTWQESGEINGWVNGLTASPDGRLLAIGGDTTDQTAFWLSEDGGASWQRLSGDVFAAESDVDASVDRAEIGGAGIVAFGMAFDPGPPFPPISVSKDGLTYTEDHENNLVTVVDDATGETIFEDTTAFTGMDEFRVLDEENRQFTIVDPDTGAEIMTITFDEMDDANRSVDDRMERSYRPPAGLVWYSADGVTWSRQSMMDAFAATGFLSGLVVTEDRAVVAFHPEDTNLPEFASEEEANAFFETYDAPRPQVWVGRP